MVFLVPLFPFVQEQWLNLYLLDKSGTSYYSILYYLSGFLFPLIVVFYSLNNFLKYRFSNIDYGKRNIKNLLYPTIIILFSLSILITKYFIYIIYVLKEFFGYSFSLELVPQIIILIIFSILLITNKTKMFVKRFVLSNFFIISIILWTTSVSNYIQKDFLFFTSSLKYSFLNINNLSVLNILYLLSIEIIYYLWSYISYKNNLSNWVVSIPSRPDIVYVFKIFLFYIGISIYYLILNLISPYWLISL